MRVAVFRQGRATPTPAGQRKGRFPRRRRVCERQWSAMDRKLCYDLEKIKAAGFNLVLDI